MALEFIKPTYSAVKSVNGKTGEVEITAEELGAATQVYVDNKVAEVATGGTINLDAYATKKYVDDAVAAIDIPEAPAPDIDLSDYYTKSEIDETFATVDYVNNLSLGGGEDIDLTGYATETYVDEAIAAIELTPGPAGKDGADGKDGEPGKDGKDGADGKDYVLTEADKEEIAGMVPGAEVDLSDYYTKSEVDESVNDIYTRFDTIETNIGETYATKEYVNNLALGGGSGDIDLTANYYSKSEVDAKIGEFPDITDEDGNQFIHSAVDYIHYNRDIAMGFTDELRYEIEDNYATKEYVNNLALGGDVDLGDYYTKSEIDDLLANLPTGDIPYGEEVRF